MERLKPGQLLTREELGEHGSRLSIPHLQGDERENPLWDDEFQEFLWFKSVPVLYEPRTPRQHLQPIEDEL